MKGQAKGKGPAGVRASLSALVRFALDYPGAYEDRPWGERVAKVAGKVFVFFGGPGDELTVTVKLPSSGALALSLPFVSPTGYGLGKSGWVTARLGARDRHPLPVLKQWIDESYRAVAPKKMVATIGAETAGPARPAPPFRGGRPRRG